MSNDAKYVNAGDALLIVQPDGAGILPEERDEEKWATEIAHELDKHYPGHPWVVSFSGGALIVRHIEISHAVMMTIGKQGFGSVLPPHRQGRLKDVLHSAVMNAGEMLECFSMPRGKWSIEYPPLVPANWKRGQKKFN